MYDRQMYNADTGNWVTYLGGGEQGMDWQMDDDCRMQAEWDAEMEDRIADTTQSRTARVMDALVYARDRKRRADNRAAYEAMMQKRMAVINSPING